MKPTSQPVVISTLIVFALCLTACATPRKGRAGGDASARSAPIPVTFSAEGDAKLGTVVRRVGEQAGGGIVLMQGLEWYDAGELAFKNLPIAKAAEQIAATFNGKTQAAQGYHFIYPTGYEALEAVSLQGQLSPELEAKSVSVAFGAGTPLYSVFAVLGRTLAITLVADNAIAESQCGEVALPELPLPVVLEAILKSARIPGEAFEIDSESEYAFIQGRGLPTLDSLVLNAADLTDSQHRLLEEAVSLELPHPQTAEDSIEIFPGASPLEDVLESLSRQLGIRVTAEPALAQLPVNPMVVNMLPRGTAMQLLIRQWLEPRYGYTVEDGRIVVREVP